MAVEETLAKLGIEIAFDSSGLKEGITKVNNNMKVLNSELNVAKSTMQNFGNTTESLKVKAANLSDAVLNQKAKVELLNEQYKKSVEAKGEDSTATQKLKVQLNNATAKLNEMETELEGLNADIKGHVVEWKNLGTALTNAGEKIKAVGDTMQTVGKGLTKYVTTPIVAVGTIAAKTAIEFESAFAGVRKTVDATEEEFEQLEDGIRNMAKELPASTTEISSVAEAAGQLGIKTEDILSFTRVMIDLGESTNLSATEAASALAKFANVTKMSASNYSNLGSVIVALGNNFATTESDIVSMATRLAASGELAGLTEPQIMALATAMSSVGIEAEAGGSAMSKLLKQIQVAVETGSPKLNEFADVAGMTANEFKQAFEQDAISALAKFIGGLNDIDRTGKSAIVMLEEMGLTEVRLSNTILSLANAEGVLTDSIDMANSSWNENTALTNEANQRYATVESQLSMLKNSVKDIAIELGEALLPIILDMVEMVRPIVDRIKEWAAAFNELDEGSQKTILKIIAFVGALGPILTIGGKVVSSVGSMVSTFGNIATAISKAGGMAKIFSSAMTFMTGPVGIIIAAVAALVAALIHLYNTNDGFKEKVQKAWKEIQDAVQRIWDTMKPIFEKLMDVFKKVWDAIEPLVEIVGNILVDAITVVVDIIADLIEILSPLIDLLVTALGWIADVVGSITSVFSEAIPEVERFDNSVSEATQEAVGAFMDLEESATVSLNQLSWSGQEITTEMKDNLVGTFTEMKDQIISSIQEEKVETEKLLTEELATLTSLTEEEKQKMIADAGAAYDEKERITIEGTERINEILSLAAEENRAITQAESDEINRIKSEMLNTAVEVMSENEAEQAVILERMKANATDLSAQQSAEIVKNSIDQKNKTIEAAEQEYNERLKAAAKLRSQGTAESEKAANEIIANAERQKEETIARAEEMHQRVVEEAQNQAGEHINKINWETGEIKSNWTVFWEDVGTGIANGWSNIKDWFNNGIENIKTSWTEGWNNVKTDFTNTWNSIKDGIKNGWNNIKTNTAEKIQEMKTDISEKWNSIKEKTTETWGNIKTAISDKVGPIVENVKTKWNDLKTNTLNKWNEIKTGITDKIGSIKETITGKFQELIDSAKNWAHNMMDGFIQGIKDKIQSVRNATANVINNIKDFLGFHSPAKEGEGKHITEWGENMILGFIDGMNNKTQTLRNRMNDLFQTPNFTSNLDIGLSSLKRPDGNSYKNTTNNNNTTNNSNFTLRIDNFINEREQNIESLVEEIEFYRTRKLAAKGG